MLEERAPIDMVLCCPACGAQHIDTPNPALGWTNPPHRSHLCGGCGHVWRPADVPTNGVLAVKTRGKHDSVPLQQVQVLEHPPVTQAWLDGLPLMQQTVLLTALRGPDTIRKDHVAKLLLRWLRRCVLLSAFDRRVLATPYELGGGSFTGPSLRVTEDLVHPEIYFVHDVAPLHGWPYLMHKVLDAYLKTVDELPHHFQLHFMHAAEILGYKHPDAQTRDWWNACYGRLVNDLHLRPESETTMDIRLGDDPKAWRAAEEVVAD